jgi:hypothetical protein
MKSVSTKSETTPSPWFQIHPTLGVSLMDHLYAKLNAMYPGKWSALFKSEVEVKAWRETWAQAFEKKHISTQQVSSGLDNCIEQCPKFPPTLGEFLEACKTVTPASHRSFAPALVHKMTKEEREAGLGKLKAMSEKLFAEKRA